MRFVPSLVWKFETGWREGCNCGWFLFQNQDFGLLWQDEFSATRRIFSVFSNGSRSCYLLITVRAQFVILLDNTPYHNVVIDGVSTKSSTKRPCKNDLLQRECIPFDKKISRGISLQNQTIWSQWKSSTLQMQLPSLCCSLCTSNTLWIESHKLVWSYFPRPWASGTCNLSDSYFRIISQTLWSCVLK